MAAIGMGGGQGPTLHMTVSARDNTKQAFDRVQQNMNKLQTTALRTMSSIGGLSMSFATLGRVTGLLNDEQARAIGVFGTTISVITAVANVVKMLTAIEWAHVAALTWKVALLTLGIGVAVAAAAALAVLAMQTNKAADAQKSYNTELEKGNRLQRRGTSQKIISRSGYVEILD